MDTLKTPIYFDYNATTPLNKSVLDAMLPYFTQHFGNPNSQHRFGWQAQEAIRSARELLSSLIGSYCEEIYFTSGSTEAINLAIKGVWQKNKADRNHFITVKTEHSAVLKSFEHIEKLGAEVDYLDVDSSGLIDLGELSDLIKDSTCMVCVMMVNNETGVIQDIESIGHIAKSKGILFMSDTTQAIGKTFVDVNKLGVDILCVSGHKIYGPAGVGALYIRKDKSSLDIEPLIHGGGHESGLRSGSLNVAGIVGLSLAAQKTIESMQNNNQKYRHLEQLLMSQKNIKEYICLNSKNAKKATNTLNFRLKGAFSRDFMQKNHSKLAISLGSACAAGSKKGSHVLRAMGLSESEVNSSLRISFGELTSDQEVQFLAERIMAFFTVDA